MTKNLLALCFEFVVQILESNNFPNGTVPSLIMIINQSCCVCSGWISRNWAL